MYNQQNFNSFTGSTSSFGGFVNSQYRGNTRGYQPTGAVPSVYGQTSGSSFAGYQSQSPTAFHSSSYRGHQPGHDNYLRSDASRQSAGSQFGTSSWSAAQPTGLKNMNQSQYTNQSSFHSSGYRGSQQGHDNYATRPSAGSSFGSMTGTGSMGMMGAGSIGMNQMGTGSHGAGSMSMASSPYSNFQSSGTSSFHTSGYRGNQQGHDNHLHAPTGGSQYGASSYGSFGAGRF